MVKLLAKSLFIQLMVEYTLVSGPRTTGTSQYHNLLRIRLIHRMVLGGWLKDFAVTLGLMAGK